jgi:hypothetical protein
MSTSSSPVRVDATLETGLSRWLWLVKWLLVIPHYIVLFFLWTAFLVLSVVALVTIVFTGRYPRGIFDFNVGVLRWSWRVAYYAYGGLGTDHYPPFSLSEVPDYPAHLEVAYPEQLSRGLALVKWWLLAIPHYLVLAVFLGGGWYVGYRTDRSWEPPFLNGGLIGLMVLVAAVVLLFTGSYPRPVFDFVLGMNRWVLRVAAYVALMTDQYPPFRLDMGGAEPGATSMASSISTMAPTTSDAPPSTSQTPGTTQAPGTNPSPPSGTAPPTGPAPRTGPPAPGGPDDNRWGPGRVIAVVVGALVFLLAGGLLTAGATLGIADGALRDSDGFLMSPSVPVESSGSAVVSQTMKLRSGTSSVLPESVLGDLKTRVDASSSHNVFVGVAKAADAARYLTGVAHSTVLDPTGSDGDPTYRQEAGGLPATAPAQADIWVTSAEGPGRQAVTWPAREGDWTVVVMNSDGSRGVYADVAIGATVPAATDLVVGLLVTGLVLLAASVITLVLAVRRRARQVAG